MITNDLRHKIVREHDGLVYYIDIKLNDECHNGHEDFSVTGMVYEKDKPKIERYCRGGGAISDEIAKLFPELAPLCRLHLADMNGVSMYAIASGMFHLTEDKLAKERFCEYYRVTAEEYEILKKCCDKVDYYFALLNNGIIARWKLEAEKAIEQLEAWTGNMFKSTATKDQLDTPSHKEITQYKKRFAEGYYTPSATAKRVKAEEQAAWKQKRDDVLEEKQSAIRKAKVECKVDLYILAVMRRARVPVKKSDNYIFDRYDGKLHFNFHSYDALDAEELDRVFKAIKHDKEAGLAPNEIREAGTYKG